MSTWMHYYPCYAGVSLTLFGAENTTRTSPCIRGANPKAIQAVLVGGNFSRFAGVILSCDRLFRCKSTFPCIDGDVPYLKALDATKESSSPHRRG